MIFIAHRANLLGPNKETENSPKRIQQCLDLGFDVEVDVRMKDGFLYLGHDKPQYRMPDEFLTDSYGFCLWFHCKDFESFEWFRNREEKDDIKMVGTHEYFWHDADDYVRTSNGTLWVYPGKPIPSYNAICVLPENDMDQTKWPKATGVCTDWPDMYKQAYHLISILK